MRCCPIGSSFPKRPARAFTSAPIRNRRYSPFTSLQSSVARNPTRHCEIVKIAYLPINVAQNGFDRSLFHIFPLPRFDAALPDCYYQIAGWSSLVARWAHNPKVASSNLAPATKNSNKTRHLQTGRESGPCCFSPECPCSVRVLSVNVLRRCFPRHPEKPFSSVIGGATGPRVRRGGTHLLASLWADIRDTGLGFSAPFENLGSIGP